MVGRTSKECVPPRRKIAYCTLGLRLSWVPNSCSFYPGGVINNRTGGIGPIVFLSQLISIGLHSVLEFVCFLVFFLWEFLTMIAVVHHATP